MSPPSLVAACGRWSSAGGVVFDATGRVALVLQADRSNRLRWTLPKGRIDAGESMEAAALREVREEAGLHARITGYLGRHEGERHFTHYFAMAVIRDSGSFDRHETADVRFVNVEKAKRLLRSKRDRAVLDWALDGQREKRFGTSTVRALSVVQSLGEPRVA